MAKRIDKKDWWSILNPITTEYGGKKIELNYDTPFQLLCAVILSAQTTDKQVNRITPPFFLRVREPHDIIDMSLEEIEEHLKYVNFFRNKSRFIKETGTILATKHGGILPNDLKLIQTFPGIGVKTAKVVLSVLYDMPYVWVDTHIHRVMNRLWVVTTKTPEQTDKELDKIFDTEIKRIIHHPIVLFGRYHCIARKPKCDTCPIAKDCKYNQEANTKEKVWKTY
jgi:endonuclease-3